MKKSINIASFLFSFICMGLLVLFSFSGNSIDLAAWNIHPLSILLILTLLTLLGGVIGMTGIKGWAGLARSVLTIVISLGLSAFLIIVLFVGSLFGVSS